MDVEKVAEFPPIAMESFLAGSDYGRELLAAKTSEFTTFRVRCREFLDRLIVVILKSPSASSRVSRGLYSFCPELLLEGDGQLVFRLFSDLCRILETCGALLSDESKAAVEEFSSYVLERRSHHEASMGVASGIPDIVSWLLRDFGFQARVHACRVLKLCVLITGRPRENYPAVTFDLSGSKLSEQKFRKCLLLVQSYVLSPGYSHRSFFTDPTLDAVEEAIADAGVFYVAPNFDLWTEFCSGIAEAFASRYQGLYDTSLQGRRQSFESYYSDLNKSNRLARALQGTSVAATSGGNVSVLAKGKGPSQRAASTGKSSSSKEATTSSSPQKKNKKKPKKVKDSTDEDPESFQELKKL